MFRPLIRAALVATLATAVCHGRSADAAENPSGTPANAAALEALQRLKGLDLEASPALKSAVLRVLDTTRGTAQFVDLVRDFHLSGQEDGLLEVAAGLSGDPAGAAAARQVLDAPGGAEKYDEALAQAGAPAPRRLGLLQSLANTAAPAAVPALSRCATNAAAPATHRAVAVHGLARTEAGARTLIRLGQAGALDDAARNTAGLDLAQSRWPAVRTEAAQVFPPPRAADGTELPPIGVLARERGDAVRGAAVFRSEQAACIKCHRVGTEGLDFGPALSEIGTKLAREAMLEAILDPSAGIAFGYEGWTLETRDGNEFFGMIASETAEEVALKQQTGAVVKIRKADIARREMQRLSIMPAGLAQILTRQQLVDVVEYLVTLKAR